jgi:hypothetical protein
LLADVRAQGRRVGGGDGEVDGLRPVGATPLNPSIHMALVGQGLVCCLPYIRWWMTGDRPRPVNSSLSRTGSASRSWSRRAR